MVSTTGFVALLLQGHAKGGRFLYRGLRGEIPKVSVASKA